MDEEAPRDDEVLEALAALVETLAETKSTIDKAIAGAKRMRRQRVRGSTYSDIVSKEDELVVELVTAMLRGLFDAGSRLRRAEARALSAEGLSMERIGELFGVSRQRVSELLRLPPTAPGQWWGTDRRRA